MSKSVEEQSEAIVAEVKAKAMEFALDNFTTPNQQAILLVETAMMIGAGIAMRNDLTFFRKPAIVQPT